MNENFIHSSGSYGPFMSSIARADVPEDVAAKKWGEFKKTYHRQYRGDPLEGAKFEIFRMNLNRIEEMNETNKKTNGQEPFGITQFSDLTPAEFKSRLLTYKPPVSKPSIEVRPLELPGELPNSVDWRTSGTVSDVKDQGACGSCWAFSVIEQLESALFQKTGKMSLLSAQQVNSCSIQDGGCNGGNTSTAFDYLSLRGAQLESSYPYTSGSTGSTGSCQYRPELVVATMASFSYAIPSCQSSGDPSCNGQIGQEPALAIQIAFIRRLFA
jgi:cathepsin F